LVNLLSLGDANVTCSGPSLSIRETVAVTFHVLPARSSNSNMNIPLVVKIFPVAFNPVIVSLNPVTIASIFPVVHPVDDGIYSTVAVGGVVS